MLGMVGRAQDVADVVQQGADDIFLVLPVAVRARGGLQRMLQPVDGEAAAIAHQEASDAPAAGRADRPVEDLRRP